MVNKSVGRISHAECEHPDTAHFKAKCREEKIAAALAAAPKKRTPRKKAVEVQPLSKGEARLRRSTTHTAAPTPPESPGLPLSMLQNLSAALESVTDNLTAYATLVGAAVMLKVDDQQVRAVHDGHDWHIHLNGVHE